MGKRKERRHAALSNAGRRVKLDLFVEPSGGLGGSSLNGEVGGDIDPTQPAGVPNSPSSSGQPPQNPLLLLGQYSDDDLDEESSKKPNQAVGQNSPSHHVDQEGPPSDGKERDFNAIEDIAAEKVQLRDMKRDSTPVDILQHPEGGDFGEDDVTASADKCEEFDSTKYISGTGSGASDAQHIGDVSSGWRMVMHEETNQYYYWNTETGETSWEVPDVLAQNISIPDEKAPANENMENVPVGTNVVSSTLGIGLDSSAALTVDNSNGANLINQSQEVPCNGPQINDSVEGCKIEILKDKNWATYVHQNDLQSNLSAANALLGAASTNDEIEEGMDCPTDLIRQCECLLEKLKSLQGYGSRLQCHDQISKYILELDIRLSDIKSLSSHGSTLRPFWVHSKRQVKQLEDVINKEIYHLAVSAQMDDDVEATANTSVEEKEGSWGSGCQHSESDRCENNRKSEFASVATNVENYSHNDPCELLGSPNEHLECEAVVSEKVTETPKADPEFHSGEDVMDVDMEVEDEVSEIVTALGDDSSTKFVAPAKQFSQSNTPPEYPTLTAGDESSVPPPPEEDWIPPPPPDGDQVPPPPPDSEQVPPPPPPDEPPESSYSLLPSYPETHQPLPYTEQYNLSYPDPNFQYYGHTVTVPSGNLFGHADGSQVGVSHASLYYETVANTYVETTPVIVSPLDPLAYYNLIDGSMASLPDVRVESSHLRSESVSVGYDAYVSDQIRIVDKPSEAGQILKLDVSASVTETVPAYVGLTSNSIGDEIPSTTNVTENFSAPSTNPSNAAKIQSKVPRGKKRSVPVAPSLRSNKKVSSLVDKWKAAKEELNEEEENEPENAYEILEKKRRKDIEEWHAKQIASGEAKDNANFQPLGGDWRERVKRRRALADKEAAKTSPETHIVENQQPDLAKLSKELPSGWQAYWDEASKKVYYGNAITSETTWSKPTK